MNEPVASTLELLAVIATSVLLAFLIGAAWGYLVCLRTAWGVVLKDERTIVGDDVSEPPSFLDGQRITPVERIPYESALRDVR